MIVIDCSNQKEQETNASGGGPLNMRLDFTTTKNVAAQTTVYCLIIYDRIFTYTAFDGYVNQIL